MRKLVGAGGLTSTLSWKVLLAVAVPSLTVTVMLAEPVWPGTGVTVTVRSPAFPPNTISESRTSAWSEEVPETVRLEAAVSASATVKGSGSVAVSAAMRRLVSEEIVGG